MGNFNSSQFDNSDEVSGGFKRMPNMSLKEVQNKIVQLFSHIGIMNKNADVKQFLKTIVDNTNPSLKELNNTKNKQAIENLKDFMVEALGMDFVKSIDDPMVVLKTAFQLLNSIVNGMSQDVSVFRANLETNVDNLGKMVNMAETLISKLKIKNTEDRVPKHKVDKMLIILDHVVKMIRTQKDFVSILLNSAKLKETEVDLEELSSSSDYRKRHLSGMRVNDVEVSKMIMLLLNTLGRGGVLIADINHIQKLAKDKHLDIPAKSLPELEKLAKEYNLHLKEPTVENITQWITSIYRVIEEKKKEPLKKRGGADNDDDDLEAMLMNKNSVIMSSLVEEFLGSSDSVTGGIEPLRTTLRSMQDRGKINKSQIFLILAKSFNKELLRLGEMFSGLQKHISPSDYKLNEDLERYVKRFLIFQTFRTKSIYLALVGYFSDVQSKFLREDFLSKLLKLQQLSKEFEAKHPNIKEVRDIDNQLKVIHASISDLSVKFREKFGGDDTERYRHIQDISILDIPDLTDVNNKLIKNVVNTLYFIRLKNMTSYIKKFKLYQSDDYDKLVGQSIAEDLDKVREDYQKIMSALSKFEEDVSRPEPNEVKSDNAITLNHPIFVYYTKPTIEGGKIVSNTVEGKCNFETNPAGLKNDYKLINKIFLELPQNLTLQELSSEEGVNLGKRDWCAWGRKGTKTTKWVISESQDPDAPISAKKLNGMELLACINNYKEFIKLYYESYINLVYAAQGLDQYLKHFTDKIRINPELIEKLELLLENTNIAAVLFDKTKVTKLVLDILDPNEYHLPEDDKLVNNKQRDAGRFAAGAGDWMTKDQAYRSVVALKDTINALYPGKLSDTNFTAIHNAAKVSTLADANAVITAAINNVPGPAGNLADAAIPDAIRNIYKCIKLEAKSDNYGAQNNAIGLPGGNGAGIAAGVLAAATGNPVAAAVTLALPGATAANIAAAANGNPASIGAAIVEPKELSYPVIQTNPGTTNAQRWQIQHNYHYAYSDLKPMVDLIYNRVPSKNTRPNLVNVRTLSYLSTGKDTREGYPFMLFTDEKRKDPQFNTAINKLLNTKEFYKNNTILKNILSIFFNLLKDSFTENKEQKYMEPKAILNAMMNYLSFGIYKFTYTRPTHGLGKFTDPITGVPSSDNSMHNISLMSLMDNDNLSVFNENYTAMNLLDTNVRVGMVNVNDVDFENFPESRNTIHGKGHTLLMHMLKAITAKTLTLLGLYDIQDYKNNKAYRVNLMDPTRVVLGGAPRNYAIREEYSEFYVRLPLIVEFYRMVFYDSMRKDSARSADDLITLTPELNEPFGNIFRHIFLYFQNKSVVDYNETEMREIIADINDIIMFFKDKADKDVSLLKFVIYKMIEEVNHKYGVLNRFEYNKYLEKTYEYLNLKHYNVNEVSSFDLMDDALFTDDGLMNDNLPSDLYSTKPELINTQNISSAYKKKFNISGDYQVLKSFRHKVFSLLLETAREENFIQAYNTQATLFGLDEILSELKLTIKNSKNDQEKFKHIFKLISSTSSFQKIDTMKMLVIHEFIVTQLKVVNNILSFLEQLRVRFSNTMTIDSSAHYLMVLNSTFNGAAGRYLKNKSLSTDGTKKVMDTSRVRMMGTLPGYSNLSALGLHPHTLNNVVVTTDSGEFLSEPRAVYAAAANGDMDNPNTSQVILNLNSAIAKCYTDTTNPDFYNIFNPYLARLLHVVDYNYRDATPPANPGAIPTGNTFNNSFNPLSLKNYANPRVAVAGAFPTITTSTSPAVAINNNDVGNVYKSYFVDLMEHDVFKLLRKLLLHPNICELSTFNNKIKLDLTKLEQNLEKQLTNLISLFNDVKLHLHDNVLIAHLNNELAESFAKYELLFKTTFSTDSFSNPIETISRTISNVETFLNSDITIEHFTENERKKILPNEGLYDSYYIGRINKLAQKFWSTFFISYAENYGNAATKKYKEVLNHYRIVNAYSESINKRTTNLSYPVEVFMKRNGPRARDHTLELNDLIFVEPHNEAFSTNGLFDFDVVSYFNNILGNFLKGCMNEDDKKIYKLCPEYINYTNDSLDNTIDNRLANIKNITYQVAGLNYADTISNGLWYNGYAADNASTVAFASNKTLNVLPDILNPYLVSHRNMNEKTETYFNLYDVNIRKRSAAANGAISNCFADKQINSEKFISDFESNSRGLRRLQVNNKYLVFTDTEANKNNSTIIDQPMDRLSKSLYTNTPVAIATARDPFDVIGTAGALAGPDAFRNMLVLCENPIIAGDTVNNCGGLVLHAANGDMYRSNSLSVAISAARGPVITNIVTNAPADFGLYAYPLDLLHLGSLMNFGISTDPADKNNTDLLNKNNFMDNNYLGVQLNQLDQSVRNNSVLLRSNATVVRNLLANYDSNKDVKTHLYENVAEIPQKTKDAMLGVCNHTKYQINILQKLIKCLNAVQSKTSGNNLNRNRAICNNIFSHINALNKQIDIILLELSDEKFNYGENSMDNFESIKNLTDSEPNISISSCLFNYLSDCKQYPVHNTTDLKLEEVKISQIDKELSSSDEITGLFYTLNPMVYFNNDFTPLQIGNTNLPNTINRLIAGVNVTDNIIPAVLAAAIAAATGAAAAAIVPLINAAASDIPAGVNVTQIANAAVAAAGAAAGPNPLNVVINAVNALNNTLPAAVNITIAQAAVSIVALLVGDPLKAAVEAAAWNYIRNAGGSANKSRADFIRFGRLNYANSLKPNYTSLQSALFAIRKLYSNNKLSLNDFSYLKKVISLLNNSVDVKINESLFNNILSTLTELKFHPDEDPFGLTLSAAYSNITEINPKKITGWNDPYLERTEALIPAINPPDVTEMNKLRNTLRNYFMKNNSLLLSVEDNMDTPTDTQKRDRYNINNIATSLNSDNNKNEENNFLDLMNKFLQRTYNSKAPFNPFANKDYLIRLNILDLNIMPIDINAMSREIPLAYLFNYASSFDDYLTDMTEGSIISKQILDMRVNSSNRTLMDKINGFCSSYFKEYSASSNPRKNISFIYDKYLKEIQKKALGFTDVDNDRMLHYNAFINIAQNIYTSTSAYHVINGADPLPLSLTTETSCLKDYEHFMENNNYKGCAINNVNAMKLKTTIAGAQESYYDLYSGIQRCSAKLHGNAKGVFDYYVSGNDFYNTKLVNVTDRVNRMSTVDSISKVHNPFDNLYGLSTLTGGNFHQSITVLPELDSVKFFHNMFDEHVYQKNDFTTVGMIAASVLNPDSNGNDSFNSNDRRLYPHSDLNTGYLNRFKVNHIGRLNTRGGGAGNIANLTAAGTSIVTSIYQLLGRFDIRYYPVTDLSNDKKKREARLAHVMSRFLYSDNGFSFTFSRHLYFINFAFNLIRHKIKRESLYNTNRVIQGKLYYQDEYEQYDNVMLQEESLLRKLPRNSLNYGEYTEANSFKANSLDF